MNVKLGFIKLWKWKYKNSYIVLVKNNAIQFIVEKFKMNSVSKNAFQGIMKIIRKNVSSAILVAVP